MQGCYFEDLQVGQSAELTRTASAAAVERNRIDRIWATPL